MNLFETRQLGHNFGNGPVLSNVSFHVAEGECFGIIGPNGSGKSTLVKILSGLFPPSSGSVHLLGQPVRSYRKRDLARFLAVLEQEGTPALSFTVEQIVAMGRYPHLRPFTDLSRADEAIVARALKDLDLWDKRHQPTNTLSGGQRQLVALARAMVQQPQILILDEPITYLDIGHQTLVMEQVRHWQRQAGISVIMVLHDLNLAGQYCDKLLLLEDGRVRAWGKVADVLRQDTITSVYKTSLIQIEHPLLGVPQFLLCGS